MKEYKCIGLWWLVVMPLLFLSSCGDDDDYNVPIQIETGDLKNVTYDSAECGGEIVAGKAKERGVCWSTSSMPTVEASKTQESGGSGVFKSFLTGLSEGTTYYVRAWAKNGSGEVVYGEQKQCVTMAHGRPVVSINGIEHIKEISAVVTSQMLVDGGIDVNDYGIIYSETEKLSLTEGIAIKLAVSKNPMKTVLNNLTDNTVYYVMAYATYSAGTVYSGISSFSTIKYTDPVSFLEVNNITGDSFEAKVMAKSGTPIPILEYGVVYGKTTQPTVEKDAVKKVGEGDGESKIEIDGLDGDTQYYARPYTKNKNGISYGEEVLVLTLSNKALISTIATTHITAHRAFIGGEILSLGLKNAPIKEVGVCWNTKANPTIEDNLQKVNLSEVGEFDALQLFCLNPSTQYYARAYVTNEYGTNYGEEITFTTREPVASYFKADLSKDDTEKSPTLFNGFYMSSTYPTDVSIDQSEAYQALENVVSQYGGRTLKYFRVYLVPDVNGAAAYLNSVAYYANAAGTSNYSAIWRTKLDISDEYVFTCSHSNANGTNATNLAKNAQTNGLTSDLLRSVEYVTQDSFVIDWNDERSTTVASDDNPALFSIIPIHSPEKYKKVGAFRITGVSSYEDWW